MELNPSSHQLAGRGSAGPRRDSRVASSAPASFDPSAAGNGSVGAGKAPHGKEYGSAFAEGFLRYLDSGDLSDVVVDVVADVTGDAVAPGSQFLTNSTSTDCPAVSPPPSHSPLSASTYQPAMAPSLAACSAEPYSREYRLHGLLLTRHSAFFAAALGQEHFADSAARRIRLTLDPAAAPAWPTLVRFFYTDRVRLGDDNALALLALARQLLVPELDSYCVDFVHGRLCASNCLAHLRAAVRFALHDLHAECVALAAQGFPLLYGSDLSGLPPSSLLEILMHPLLQVHCELQVVEAITSYLASTAVDAEAARALCGQIRFPYLDNATITRLAVQPSPVLAAANGGGGPTPAPTPAPTPTPAQTPREQSLATSGESPGATRGDTEKASAPVLTSTTHGSEAVAGFEAGQPASRDGAAGAGGSASQTPENGTGEDGRGVEDGAATDGSVERPPTDIGGPSCAAAAAADGSSGGGADDRTGAAADENGDDSGLLSASTSAFSSLTSSAGGAEPAHQHSHAGGSGWGTAAAGHQQPYHSHPMQHPFLHTHSSPLVPRDLALEGALARLAAMEFHSLLPQPFTPQGGGSPLEHSHSSAAARAGAGHPPQYPYHHYLAASAAVASGTGGAAQLAAAAAAAGRRPLAIFRAVPEQAPAPQPPPHYQLMGGEGPGLYAHALAPGHPAHHNNNNMLPEAPAQLQQQANPVHPASSSRALGSGQKEGGGGEAKQQPAAGGAAAAPPADTASAFASCRLPPPRLSYCCNVTHGLPGGCAWVDVALEALWEHLVPYITVQVSGCGEGSPHHVVSTDPDCYFETNDSAEGLPWVEVQLPHNVHVLHLHRYNFLHGHRRAGYYRARNFKTQIAARPASESQGQSQGQGPSPGGPGVAAAGQGAGPQPAGNIVVMNGGPTAGQRPGPGQSPSSSSCRYYDLTTRMTEQFDVGILSGASAVGPWRVMRLQAIGAQEDGVHRLCVRSLRMYGVARIDLMQQANGFVVQPHWIVNARIDHGGRDHGGGGVGGVGGGMGPGGGGVGGSGGSGMHYWGSWPGRDI